MAAGWGLEHALDMLLTGLKGSPDPLCHPLHGVLASWWLAWLHTWAAAHAHNTALGLVWIYSKHETGVHCLPVKRSD